MTITEALDNAVSGGYHMDGLDGMETDYAGANSAFTAWTRTDNASTFQVAVEETFLDPRFWQALGRALGWSAMCDRALLCVHGEEEYERCRGSFWMYQWHRFIQALAEGNPPDAFFASLPSSQRMASGTPYRHQAGRAHPHRFCPLLSATATRQHCQATRQHSQHLCGEAAGAQERARERIHRRMNMNMILPPE